MQSSKIKLFALIGYPVAHTLSPYMQMAAFSRLKIKALYIPLAIEPKRLAQAIKMLRSGTSGFNVTIPHKSACMQHLDSVDKLARMIGAVNTVVVKNERLFGFNTDATGFIKSVKTDLKITLKNKACLVVGAGGAGRAVAFALAKEGAKEVFIVDVQKAKAVSLVRNIKKYFPKCRIEASSQHSILNAQYNIDLLVNATPLGMKKTDPLPIDLKILNKTKAVYDLIYNISPTRLVKTAKQRSIKASNGLGMLLYQGAEAFQLWTHKKAPVEVMRKALKRKIAPSGKAK